MKKVLLSIFTFFALAACNKETNTSLSTAARWLREQVREVAHGLASHGMLARSRARVANE